MLNYKTTYILSVSLNKKHTIGVALCNQLGLSVINDKRVHQLPHDIVNPDHTIFLQRKIHETVGWIGIDIHY